MVIIHYEGYSAIVYEIYAIGLFLYGLPLIHGCRKDSWWICLILGRSRGNQFQSRILRQGNHYKLGRNTIFSLVIMFKSHGANF